MLNFASQPIGTGLFPSLPVCLLQVHELDSRHSTEAMKAEKWQFEYKNLHDKYEALVKEKEVKAPFNPHLEFLQSSNSYQSSIDL
jgi:hypothetical protein